MERAVPVAAGEGCVASLASARSRLEGRVSPSSLQLLPRALGVFMLGRRCLVVRADEQDTQRLIEIPEQYKGKQSNGFVVACGPFVGTNIHSRPPGGWHLPNHELLLREVVFGVWTGKELLLPDERNIQRPSDYLIMDDHDFWLVVEEK